MNGYGWALVPIPGSSVVTVLLGNKLIPFFKVKTAPVGVNRDVALFVGGNLFPKNSVWIDTFANKFAPTR